MSQQEEVSQARKACVLCGNEFTGNLELCPDDGTLLTPIGKEPRIGDIIADRYEILGVLGDGGMGKVYKARHNLMKRIVAIKMLLPHLVQSGPALKRFQQEAQAASALKHPHIMTVHDFGISDKGLPFLVMDYLEGVSLSSVIQELGALPQNRAVDIFIQACSALSHAHKNGVVHRDLKPANLMLIDFDGQPDFLMVVDFGIAKLLQPDASVEQLTHTGEVFGSPLYMSPEQCRGRELDPRSDIYSLGCVLYRTVTGRPVFGGRDAMECMFKQVNDMPGAFSEVCPEYPLSEQLEAAIFKALAKEPEQRYQTMAEFRDALEAVKGPAAPVRRVFSVPPQSGQEVAYDAATDRLRRPAQLASTQLSPNPMPGGAAEPGASTGSQHTMPPSGSSPGSISLSANVVPSGNQNAGQQQSSPQYGQQPYLPPGSGTGSTGAQQPYRQDGPSGPQGGSGAQQQNGPGGQQYGSQHQGGSDGQQQYGSQQQGGSGGQQQNGSQQQGGPGGQQQQYGSQQQSGPGGQQQQGTQPQGGRGGQPQQFGSPQQGDSGGQQGQSPSGRQQNDAAGQGGAQRNGSAQQNVQNRDASNSQYADQGQSTDESNLRQRRNLDNAGSYGQPSGAGLAGNKNAIIIGAVVLVLLIAGVGVVSLSSQHEKKSGSSTAPSDSHSTGSSGGSETASTGSNVNEAKSLIASGNYQNAEMALTKAVSSTESDKELADLLPLQARVYEQSAKYPQAQDAWQKLLDIQKKNGASQPDMARTKSQLALPMLEQGNVDQAEPLLNEAEKTLSSAPEADKQGLAHVYYGLSKVALKRGDYNKAIETLEEAIGRITKVEGAGDPELVQFWQDLAEVYLVQGKLVDSEIALGKMLKLAEDKFGKDSAQAADAFKDLGTVYFQKGNLGKSETYFKKSLAIKSRDFGASSVASAEVMTTLAMLYTREKKYKLAEPLFKDALAIRTRELGADSPQAKRTKELYATFQKIPKGR